MARQRMRAIILEELREHAFFFSHSYPSGHFGKIGTSHQAAQRFWKPEMNGDINRWVNKCQECLAKIEKYKGLETPASTEYY